MLLRTFIIIAYLMYHKLKVDIAIYLSNILANGSNKYKIYHCKYSFLRLHCNFSEAFQINCRK